MPHRPRPYQSNAIDRLRHNFRDGIRRQLLVAPTGAGKTTIAAIMIENAIRKGYRIWFVAHRRELIAQCSRRLDDHGIDHGVIQAKHPRLRPSAPVQVVSVATAIRGERLQTLDAPGLIIVDEAHRALARSYLQIFEAFPAAAVIGLTATPWRLDGKPLGDRFDRLVLVATPQELIDLGYLVAPTVYAPSAPDLSGVHVARGDYAPKGLDQAVNRATLIGDMVHHWKTIVEPTGRDLSVVFAVNKRHSMAIRDRFLAAGIPAAHIDEETPGRERDQSLADLKAGRVRVLCNCQILTEGWDLPELGAVILARPTKSLALFLQMAGRGMRAVEGKRDWIMLDHAGAVLEHGFPQTDRVYDLETNAKKQGAKEGGPAVTICEACFAAYASRVRTCPQCGHTRTIREQRIEEVGGSLQELTPAELEKLRKNRARKIPWDQRRARLAKLYEEADRRGYSRNWANIRFRETVGAYPPEQMRTQAAELCEAIKAGAYE